MWIFDPSLQRFLRNGKIYVRVRSHNRLAYVTGTQQGDHVLCDGAHKNCRIRVLIDWTRSISETQTYVGELETWVPTKKGQEVVRIRNCGQEGAKVLLVTGLPRHYSGEKVITVCEPHDRKRQWSVPASQLTRIEMMNQTSET